MTPAQVAALLGVAPTTVTKWAEAGRLGAVRTLGGHRCYEAREVLKLHQRRRSGQGAAPTRRPRAVSQGGGEWMSALEVAGALGVNRQAVYRWRDAGLIEAAGEKVRGSEVYRAEDIRQLVQSRRTERASPDAPRPDPARRVGQPARAGRERRRRAPAARAARPLVAAEPADVLYVRALYTHLDRVLKLARELGTPEQRRQARAARDRVSAALRSRGWPTDVIAAGSGHSAEQVRAWSYRARGQRLPAVTAPTAQTAERGLGRP